MNISQMQCSLCSEKTSKLVLTHRNREFYQCSYCDLVFVPSHFHLSPLKEKAEYDRHQNDADNLGYKEFLSRLLTPLSGCLKPGMTGLDFGSGPGPVLSQMLNDQGYPTAIFDPFYACFPQALTLKYDFVTCTEVVEHFSNPYRGWQELTNLVKRDGCLAIMTLTRDKVSDFSTWWYKNDPSHVAFYSSQTLKWITAKFGLVLTYHDDDRVFLFQNTTL